jgi:SulP family sulfate permease
VRLPVRGDLIAGVTVALVLVPQSLAYAELAGTPAVYGLYTAAVATIAAGLVGSSPYLQTGPVALTSLLTFGALAPLADAGTRDFAVHASLLALVVGSVRMLLGLLRWGVVAYLMSQPVVSAFTAAAAILIVCSQLPALLDAPADDSNPLVAAGQALVHPGEWGAAATVIGLATVAVVVGGRRLHPRFPGALVASASALALSALGWVTVTEVGDIPNGFPPLSSGLPWGTLGSLLVPGAVIALVGFAEPASIARRYAAEDRTPWDADREFVGQGLANLAAGAFSGYPAGGSFSRSSLNRLSGARTRWSGVVTGLAVLAVMPVASVLSGLPRAALAGLVIAAVVTLVDFRPFVEAWRASRPQFLVALPTFVATLAFAPRVERGVLVGVGLSLAVHLWRELRLELDVWTTGDTLHVRPQGVLYFASAPSLETRIMTLMAEGPDLRHVVVHLDRLGRLDLTGALVLRSLVEDMQRADADVVIEGTQPQARRLVDAVLGKPSLESGGAPRTSGPVPGEEGDGVT